MKVVHIVNVNPGRFVLPFAKRMNQFGFKDQTFLPIGTTEKQLAFCKEIENSCLIPYPQTHNPWIVLKFLIAFSREIEGYDLIIWHSLFFQRVLLAFVLLMKPQVVKKSVWQVWGGDLYKWESKSKLLNFLYRRFVSMLKAAVVDFPPDKKVLQETFRFQKDIFYSAYQNYDGTEALIQNAMRRRQTNRKTVRILVGHSAVPEMHHMRCLDLLSKFKSEDITICLPLSYGDSAYADEIESYARGIFGEEKVQSLRNYMALNDYFDVLCNVDVAILDSTRQIALGNIYPLLYMKKSLFLTAEGVMYSYFHEEGLSVKTMEDLSQAETLTDLVFPVSDANYEFARDYYDVESFKQAWASIFEALKSE